VLPNNIHTHNILYSTTIHVKIKILQQAPASTLQAVKIYSSQDTTYKLASFPSNFIDFIFYVSLYSTMLLVVDCPPTAKVQLQCRRIDWYRGFLCFRHAGEVRIPQLSSIHHRNTMFTFLCCTTNEEVRAKSTTNDIMQ
jgi:hypothetical protein